VAGARHGPKWSFLPVFIAFRPKGYHIKLIQSFLPYPTVNVLYLFWPPSESRFPLSAFSRLYSKSKTELRILFYKIGKVSSDVHFLFFHIIHSPSSSCCALPCCSTCCVCSPHDRIEAVLFVKHDNDVAALQTTIRLVFDILAELVSKLLHVGGVFQFRPRADGITTLPC
jgi:hypothetical protein